MISGCPDDQLIRIPEGRAFEEARWAEPTARDSNGQFIPIYQRSHSQPRVYIGLGGNLRVSYVFRDGDGNTAECAFSITGIQGKIHAFLFQTVHCML